MTKTNNSKRTFLLLALAYTLAGIATAKAQCLPPTGLSTTVHSCDSVTVTWTAPAGVPAYIVAITQNANPPGAGMVYNSTTWHKGGLLPQVTYYAHIKSNCTMTVSGWVTTSFVTPACPPTICTQPVNATLTNITATSAIATWSPVTNAIGYEYAIDTTYAPPATGTPTTSTTASVTTLIPNTIHYLHVRSKCGANNYSAWKPGIIFTTLQGSGPTTCNAPASVSTTGVSANSAAFKWAAVSNAIGYEIVLDKKTSDPTSAGNPVTGTSATASNLTSSTTYYMHVRAKCSATTFSPWTTPFKIITSSSTGIANTTSIDNTIAVYPNPAHQSITVDINKQPGTGDQLAIMNIDGRTVKTITPTSKTSIDISELPAGIYFIKYTGEGQQELVRFTKD